MPFLAYQLDLLRRHGITDVVLSCSYMVDAVRAAMGDGAAWGVRLRYAVETEPLGTGGGVRNSVDLVGGGLVVVLNGDVLTDADIGGMLRFHEAHRARASIYLFPVPDPTPFGLVELEDDARVRRFIEKPDPSQITTNTINAGIYVLDRALIARMPEGRVVSIEREFFPGLLADRVPFYGWVAHHYWLDIGTPAKYRQGQVDLMARAVDAPLAPASSPAGGSIAVPAVIASGCRVASDARVGPNSVLGPGCVVGAGAIVEETTLWDDVEVGAGASLSGAIVASGAKIGAGASLGPGVVLAAGTVVPDRATLTA